jgi:outer membrane usher protein
MNNFFLVLLLLAPISAMAESLVEIPLTLRVDGVAIGEIDGRVSESQAGLTAVRCSEVRGKLAPHLGKSTTEKFDECQSIWVKVLDLYDWGVPIVYSELNLEILVTTSAVNRPEQEISLGGKYANSDEPGIEPHPFSYYFGIAHQQQVSNSSGENAAQTDLDTHLNIRGLVIESDFKTTGTVDAPGDLIRERTRFTYDRPSEFLRYTLGDITYPTIGYLETKQMGGAGVTKEFSLAPRFNASPTGRTQFFLEKDSQVSIYINSQLSKVVNLKAGTYNLDDLPIRTGFNEIRIESRDVFGNIDVIEFPIIHSATLLRPGLSYYTHNLGYDSELVDSSLVYTSKPRVTSFYKYGFSKSLSAGYFLDGSEEGSLLGGEASFTLGVGTANYEIAQTSSGETSGMASRFSYRSADTSKSRLRSWGFSHEYRDPYFNSDDPTVSNETSHTFSGFSAFLLPAAFRLTLGTQIGARRLDGVFSMNLFTQVYKALGREWNFSFRFSRERGFEEDWENHANLSVVWNPFSGGSINVNRDLSEGTSQVNLQGNSERFVGGINYYDDVGDDSRLNAKAFYESPVAYFGADHTQSNLGPSESHSSTLQVSSALIGAGSTWAISTPTKGSFAIFERGKGLKGVPLYANGIGVDDSEAFSTRGAISLPHLNAYTPKPVNIYADVTEDIYFDLDKSQFTLLPTYKSGHLIKLRVISEMYVSGKIEISKGKPLALKAGEFCKTASPQEDCLLFFTNENGEFDLEGAEPGDYSVKVYEFKGDLWKVDIPDKEGIVNLKPLVLRN